MEILQRKLYAVLFTCSWKNIFKDQTVYEKTGSNDKIEQHLLQTKDSLN